MHQQLALFFFRSYIAVGCVCEGSGCSQRASGNATSSKWVNPATPLSTSCIWEGLGIVEGVYPRFSSRMEVKMSLSELLEP